MKYIPGHEGRYAIDEYGTKVLSYSKPKKMYQGVIGWTKERYLKFQSRPRGYWCVNLSKFQKDGTYKLEVCLVHRLVAITYIGEQPEPHYQINHKDKNTSNNHYSNLEWVTPEENTRHSWENGRKAKKWKGTRIQLPVRVSIDQIKKIRKLKSNGNTGRGISRILNINKTTVMDVINEVGCYGEPIEKLNKLMEKRISTKEN